MLPLLLACTLDEDSGVEPALSDVSLEPSEEVSTMLVATWTTDVPCAGQVVWTADRSVGHTTASEPEETTEHQVFLIGTPADTTVTAALLCGRSFVGPVTGHTGELPPTLSDLPTTGTPEDSEDLLTVALSGSVNAVLLVRMDGRIVWYHLVENEARTSRMVLDVGGRSVVYNVEPDSSISPVDAGLVRVGLDGVEIERWPVDGATHDFVQREDGNFTLIAEDERDGLLGDKLVELDADGTQTVLWSTFDSFDPAVFPSDYPTDPGWTHANALDWDASTDSYWLSVRNLDTIVQIDRATASVLTRIGSAQPTVGFVDPDDAFSGEHQFEWLPSGNLLVFDNGYQSGQTRAIEYHVVDGYAVPTWTWTADHHLLNYAMGDVERQSDGSTRINLSTLPSILAVDPFGKELWRMNGPTDSAIGYSERLPGVGE